MPVAAFVVGADLSVPGSSGKCWVLLNWRRDQHGMGLAAVLTFFCLPSTPHVTGLHFMAMSFCWEGNYGLYSLIFCPVLFFLWLDITTESDSQSATNQDVASASLSVGVTSRFLEGKCRASGNSHAEGGPVRLSVLRKLTWRDCGK